MSLSSTDRLRRIVLALGILVAAVLLGPYFGLYVLFDPPHFENSLPLQKSTPARLSDLNFDTTHKSKAAKAEDSPEVNRRPLAELRQGLTNQNTQAQAPPAEPTKKALTEIEELLKEK